MSTKILLVVAFAVLASAGQSRGSAENPTREEIRQTVEHIQRIAKAQQIELDESRIKIDSLSLELTAARGSLAETKSAVVNLSKQIDNLTAWGVEWQARANAAEAKLSAIRKRYYTLKIICSSIAGALCALLVFKFVVPVLQLAPWYLVAVVGAAFAVGFGLVFAIA